MYGMAVMPTGIVSTLLENPRWPGHSCTLHISDPLQRGESYCAWMDPRAVHQYSSHRPTVRPVTSSAVCSRVVDWGAVVCRVHVQMRATKTSHRHVKIHLVMMIAVCMVSLASLIPTDAELRLCSKRWEII